MLLPLEADEKLEALKHYFGITYDGELVTRGIETRRHDTPNFIKKPYCATKVFLFATHALLLLLLILSMKVSISI